MICSPYTLKALLISSQKADDKSILKSTYGIAFLGCPHGGSPMAYFPTIAAYICNMVKIPGMPPLRVDLLEGLKKDSEALVELSESFKEIGSGIKVISFYELEQMAPLRSAVGPNCIPKPPSRLTMNRWLTNPQQCWDWQMRPLSPSRRITGTYAAFRIENRQSIALLRRK